MRSYQFGQCVDNKFDLLEDSQNKGLVVSPICIERCVSLRRFVLESNLKSNMTGRVELEVRVGFRNLEDADYSSVLNIPFIYVEGRLGSIPTLTYELYVDDGRRGQDDSQNLMLIPVRKFGQNTQEGRDFWIRNAVEGLKTKDGISYRIGNTGEFPPAPVTEVSMRSSDDESGLVAFVGIGTSGESSDGENQVIQRGPQVGDTVADDEAPSFKVGGRANSPDFKPVFGELLIAFEDKFVRVSLEPCHDFAIDDFEVVARPS